MKVIEKSVGENTVLLEVSASAAEMNRAFEIAEASFEQRMGLQPEEGKSTAQIAEEKLGIKDLDAVIAPQAFDYLSPFAVDQRNLLPDYPPKLLEKGPASRNASCSFSLEVALKPQFDLSSYEPITIHTSEFAINEEQVERQIAEMANSYAEFERIDPRPAKNGDCCLINMQADREGSPIPELTVENSIYEIGSNLISPGFDDNLIGMDVGETKSFTTDYTGQDAMGAIDADTVNCAVTLLEIREKKTPVIDDTWIKENIPAAGDLESFKNLLRAEFKKSYASDYDVSIRQLACDELAKRFEGDVSDDAFEAMQKTLMNNLRVQLMQQGKNFDEYVQENGGEKQFNLQMMMQARNALYQGYALDALFRHEKMQLSDEDILEACKTIDPEQPQMVKKQMELAGCSFTLRETAERLKASKWLVDHAEIVYQPD